MGFVDGGGVAGAVVVELGGAGVVCGVNFLGGIVGVWIGRGSGDGNRQKHG